MRIEHVGQRPMIDPSVVVAPTAVISGDVRVGAGTVVLAGAIITSQGAPVRLGQHCIVMEHAVIRGAGKYPCRLGNHVLVGPHAHIAGATVHGRAFLATGGLYSTARPWKKGWSSRSRRWCTLRPGVLPALGYL